MGEAIYDWIVGLESFCGHYFVLDHGDHSISCCVADGTIEIVDILPVHESGVPSIVRIGGDDGGIEVARAHVPVVCVLLDGGFSQDDLAGRDSPAAMISFTDVPGEPPPEELNRPCAVSYMPLPWL